MLGTKKLATIAYIIAVFISLSSYEIYAGGLSDYNVGLGFALFSLLQIPVLSLIYPKTERYILDKVGATDTINDTTEISIKDAFARQPIALVFLGISCTVSFLMMLPFLSDAKHALLFIMLYAIAGLIKVPISIYFFKDPVQNLRLYVLGIVVAFLGTVFYQMKMHSPTDAVSGIDAYLVLALCIKLPLQIINDTCIRYISSTEKVKEFFVPVATSSLVTNIFQVVIGGILGIILFFNHSAPSLMPTLTNILAILYIAVVVNITSTLGVRLRNEVKDTIAQPIQSIRILIGFVPIAILGFKSGNTSTLPELFFGVTLVCVGVAMCLFLGKPYEKIVK
jgi:hypothetical protein